MANKIFGFYKNDADYAVNRADKLVIEIGKAHLACLVIDETRHVNALEWFKYGEENFMDFSKLLDEIKHNSALLQTSFSQTNVFINNNQNVWLAPGTPNAQQLKHYLDAVLGMGINQHYQFDEIAEGGGVVNAYRVAENLLASLQDALHVSEVQHAYSRLLIKIMHAKNLPDNYMQVLLYDAEFIVATFIKGRFQLMQSYAFQMPDDVIYHVLNVSRQLNINVDELIIKVSGFIDAHSGFYTQLTRIFKNVAIESVSPGKVTLQTGNHPLHYFSPLITLAL